MPPATQTQNRPLAPALQAIAAHQGGLFTTAQALDCGYSKAEIAACVRSNLWDRLARGVFAEAAYLASLGAPDRHLLGLCAVFLKTHEPTFASHLTAAVLHGLPLIGQPPRLVSVTHPGPSATRVRAGAKHHTGRVDPDEQACIDGIPCLTVARTVGDIARTATFEQAVVVADAALRAGTPRETLEEMARSCTRWPGARRLHRTVAFARAEAESAGESVSRIVFATQGLPPPLLQVNLYDSDGLVGRADFLWEGHRTVGEFDGRVKYASGDANVLYEEKRREDRLRDAGFEVVRFSWTDVWNRPEMVAAKVRQAFARRARRAA